MDGISSWVDDPQYERVSPRTPDADASRRGDVAAEAGDQPAEARTSAQTEQAAERSQAEGDTT